MPSRKSLAIILIIIAVLFIIILIIFSVLFRGEILTDDFGLDFSDQCRTEATANCITVNSLPPTWNLPRNITEGSATVQKTCAVEFPSVQCIDRTLEGFA